MSTEFQFHIGSIQSLSPSSMTRLSFSFQFHIGSIQSPYFVASLFRINFVSIPHWFDSKNTEQALQGLIGRVSIPHWFDSKETMRLGGRVYKDPFQFHIGSIQSSAVYPELADECQVSIPHWFDSKLTGATRWGARMGVSIPHWFDSKLCVAASGRA